VSAGEIITVTIYAAAIACGFTFLLCLPQMCGGLPAAADNAGGGAQERSDRLAREMPLTHLGSGL
jgi:hypothetical protein